MDPNMFIQFNFENMNFKERSINTIYVHNTYVCYIYDFNKQKNEYDYLEKIHNTTDENPYYYIIVHIPVKELQQAIENIA